MPRTMIELRRPLLTVAALVAACTLIALFVFPGPSSSSTIGPPPIAALGVLAAAPPPPSNTPVPAPSTIEGSAPVLRPTGSIVGDGAGVGHDPVTTTTIAAETTTTTPNPPVPPTNCGGQPDVAAGQSWTCTFDDEFDGSTLDTSKWLVQLTSNSSYHSGNECYVDSPNNVSVSGGMLNLTAQSEAAPFTCTDPLGGYRTQYTSGMVSTDGRFSQAYGLFEVRAKFPSVTVPGLQSTLWLWPVNSRAYGRLWPASGEVDFAEWFSQYSGLDIPTVHYDKIPANGDTFTKHCDIDVTQFHTFGVDWTPDTMTIYLDGNVCMTDQWNPAPPESHPQPFDRPFFISLTQALGLYSNNFVPGSTPLPATTQIDWVRVWSQQ